MKNMKVAIYCRISQEKKGNDLSIDDQSKLGMEFCEEHGYSYELYIDEGLTATSTDRPEFQELLADIVSGEIQILWVYDDSRIQRSPEIRFLLNRDLKKYGVVYHTHLNGEVDLFNAEEDLRGGIMAEINKYYVSITKQKVRSVLERKIKSGRGWGIPPYGYTYDDLGYFILNEKEAEVVKEIYQMSLSGMGIESIAKLLNLRKVPTRYNGYDGNIRLNRKKGKKHMKVVAKKNIKWAGNSVRGIIKNPMFYGKKTIKGHTFEVPALFTLDYWEEVNYNMTHNNKNTKGKGGGQKYDYLLNKVIKCQKCGRNYNGKTRPNKKDHHYFCMSKRGGGGGCGNRSINIDKVEKFVWETLFSNGVVSEAIYNNIIDSSGNLKNRTKLETAESNLEKVQAERKRMLNAIRTGTITMEEAAASMEEIRDRINDYMSEIETIHERLKQLTNIDVADLRHDREHFDKMVFTEREKLVNKYIKSVEVKWIEEEQDGVLVRYYILTVTFNVDDFQVRYVNGLGMNLDVWHRIADEVDEDRGFVDGKIDIDSKEKEVPFRRMEVGGYPVFGTLVPYGDVDSWDEGELERYYGKKKYKRFKAEREHKLRLLGNGSDSASQVA